jgi:hypothetical protein
VVRFIFSLLFYSGCGSFKQTVAIYRLGAMAKDSILFSDEHSDAQLVIVVIFGIFGLFYQPLLVVIGGAIIAVPFIITWAVSRGRPF